MIAYGSGLRLKKLAKKALVQVSGIKNGELCRLAIIRLSQFVISYFSSSGILYPMGFLGLGSGLLNNWVKAWYISLNCASVLSSSSSIRLRSSSYPITICRIRTNARIIDIFTSIAVWLLNTVESIATPCSLKTIGLTELCFRVSGNWSQFVTSW